ncbi:MAG: hypothetical protein JOY99_10290 [Sphingomonadaceae bacterium]|nr:hypothetical protein [Sphingomonadaceae bacterium]
MSPSPTPQPTLDLPQLMERLAADTVRPRYAFMLLNLVARIAGESGRAGPFVQEEGALVPLRDWLCDALAPMAQRDHRRIAIVAAVRAELAEAGELPGSPEDAERTIEQRVRDRVRASGRSNVSRTVSELVRAGLMKRHYQGYRVDHVNRGAQRQAVYTLPPHVRAALSGPSAGIGAQASRPPQLALRF